MSKPRNRSKASDRLLEAGLLEAQEYEKQTETLAPAGEAGGSAKTIITKELRTRWVCVTCKMTLQDLKKGPDVNSTRLAAHMLETCSALASNSELRDKARILLGTVAERQSQRAARAAAAGPKAAASAAAAAAAAPAPAAAPKAAAHRKSAGPMTERDKMLAGELYMAFDPELEKLRADAHALTSEFNEIPSHEKEKRAALLQKLLISHPDAPPYIEPKFRCDYGKHIRVGKHFYANFDCCILDCNTVTIGDNVFFGPGVHVYTAGHPLEPDMRGTYLNGLEFAKPVVIGNNCWIGGSVVILPGVTIGDNVTVGAGSVVTKDVPDSVVVAGNPARIIKKIPGR